MPKHGINRAKYPVLHHNIVTLSDNFEGVKIGQITTNAIVFVPLNKNNSDQMQNEYNSNTFTKVDFRNTFDKTYQIVDIIARVKIFVKIAILKTHGYCKLAAVVNKSYFGLESTPTTNYLDVLCNLFIILHYYYFYYICYYICSTFLAMFKRTSGVIVSI